MKNIVLGTRGSELALAQTRTAIGLLRDSGLDCGLEERVIHTSGDLRQEVNLSDFSKGENAIVEKGVFTKELEDALLSGEIDAAVHSLKDLPAQLGEGFKLVAVLPRAPVEDILLVNGKACPLGDLPVGATVATSSVRRGRLVAWRRPDLVFCEIRGNVPTRLRKLADGRAGDATILARAGLERLGFYRAGCNEVEIEGCTLGCHVLPTSDFLPAGGQGAVAIEALAESPVVDYLKRIDDEDTAMRVAAEREFLHLLGAGCDTPVGVCANLESGNGEMRLEAVVFDETNPEKPPKTGKVSGACGDGKDMASELLRQMGIHIEV
ncbi:MAG: hydroxymethylbilane synthase [Verrucomicrobiaceae bacterium]|nr:hydroxymethylbilane synthase [Verrucomicrobiaceae bacterium]